MNIEIISRESLNMLLQKGATYADIRLHLFDKVETIGTLCGTVDAQTTSENQGFGIRVLYRGAWGFATSTSFSDISVMAEKALKNAQESSRLVSTPAKLLSKPSLSGHYKTPSEIDPFSIPMTDRVAYFLDLDHRIKRNGLSYWGSSGAFYKREIIFMDTEGSIIQKNLLDVEGSLYCFGNDNNSQQHRRSHNLFYDANGTTGWETFLNPLLFSSHSERISEDLLDLLNAPSCEKMTTNLVILNSQMALQTHETIGHALELDRILGYELSYAGGSFVNLMDFDQLTYGSDKLTVFADGTIQNSPGSFGYDDDGVQAKKTVLIENGVLKDAITSRQMASEANRITDKTLFKESGGANRASSYNRIPIERMTNINIAAGNDGDLNEIVKNCETGLLVDSPLSWSIGSNRENFHFACEAGWLIKDGKIGKMVKSPSYSGETLPFWKSLDKVGNEETWRLEVVYNCGKGQPNQIMRLGHGVPVCLFKNVQVG